MIAKKKYNIHGIRFKMRLVILLVSVVLIVAVEMNMIGAVQDTVETSMSSRLESDIHYINDLVGQGEWHIRDNALYCGDTMIGDGTPEHAYLAPFLELKEKTGTFSYTFIRCPDEGLTWVGDRKTGYQQGHYLRVSGSTLSSNGKQIIGTYMDKIVADTLDADTYYTGRANVVGEQVFCLYHILRNNGGDTVGVIVVGRSIEEIALTTRSAIIRLFWLIVGGVLLADIVLNIIMSRWLRKLDIANHYLIDISSGDFPQEPLELKTKDELMVTADCINEMTVALKEKARLSGELEAAANIQRDMLPSVFPAFPDRDEFDVFAAMHPAKEVGGDFYDLFMIDEDHLAVVIADVAGKGVPAALFMAIAKMLINNHTKTGMAPRDVFTAVNRLLCEGNETNIFVTAFMGVLELTTGKLTCVNAGHNPPLIRLHGGAFRYMDLTPGVMLAVFDGVEYTETELLMEPGDRLFLYTDGVTEAMDEADRLYGNERLLAFSNAHAEESARTVLTALRADIDAFAGAREQADDITMLMLDYYKHSAHAEPTERVFAAEPESFPAVRAFARARIETRPIPEDDERKILTAVEELFMNIAENAYPEGHGTVTLRVCADADSATLVFTDSGVPFDPLAAGEPDITVSAGERAIGGLGIFLVKKTMDEMKYTRRDGQNVLTVTKRYSGQA